MKHHIHLNSLGRKDRKCGMKEHLHQGEHLTLKLIHKDTKSQCWLAPQRPLGSELRSDWELPAKQLAPHGLEKLCPTELSAVMEMFTIHCRLGDSSPWVSHFCIFESRGTECLFFWTLFKGIYIANSFGRKRQCLPPEQRTLCILPVRKDPGLLNSEF